MLEVVRPKTSAAAATGGFDVEILSVATANPSFQLSQTEATRRAKEIFPHLKALWSLYDNTGIELRAGLIPARGNVNGGARMGYVGNMRAVMNVRAGGHRTVSCKRERSDDNSTG